MIYLFFALWDQQWRIESPVAEFSGLNLFTKVAGGIGLGVILLMPKFFPRSSLLEL